MKLKRSPSDLNMMSHPTIGVVAISRNEAEDLPGFFGKPAVVGG